MSLVRLAMSVVVVGALAMVGGRAAGRAGASVQDAVERVQAGDVRPVMELLAPPHGTIAGAERRRPVALPPAAELHRTVGEMARFAGLLMGSGPTMLVEEYQLRRRGMPPPVHTVG